MVYIMENKCSNGFSRATDVNKVDEIQLQGHSQTVGYSSREGTTVSTKEASPGFSITAASTRVVIPTRNGNRPKGCESQVSPQQLIDNLPGNPVQNISAGNAQYRKSYAFKIWRDQGLFPYKLVRDDLYEKQSHTSKKRLNSLKVQQERRNEEAWREFKKSKKNKTDEDHSPTVKTISPTDRERRSKHDLSSLPSLFATRTGEVDQVDFESKQRSIPDYFKNTKSCQSVSTSTSLKSTNLLTGSPALSLEQNAIDRDAFFQVTADESRSFQLDKASGTKIGMNLFNDKSVSAQGMNKKPKCGNIVASSPIVVEEEQENKNVDNQLTMKSSEIEVSDVCCLLKDDLTKKYCKENVVSKIDPSRGNKRRRESLHTENLGRKKSKAKGTVFSQLDKTVATDLAEGIHSVNSEYFPFGALANKAARNVAKTICEQSCVKKKVEDINRARLLLKELFDVTCDDDDHAMKTFDDESHSFGRRNILNHLTVLDRYFYEFQKRLNGDSP